MDIRCKHSFPETWMSGKYNKEVLEQIQQNNSDALIIDATWSEKLFKMYTPDQLTNKKIIIISLLDPALYDNFNEILEYITCKKSLVINSDTHSYSFWAYYAGQLFKNYYNMSFPLNLVSKFLCYNRKPLRHRTDLICELQNNNLIQFGIVTLGKDKHTHNPYMTITENDSIPNEMVYDDIGIPNDITSLGNINIWNQSFLNVVTETTDNSVWLSEKTFKPIIGKRPFVILNKKNLIRLKKLGFKTFDKYWNENVSDFEDAQHLVIETIKTVCSLSEQEIIKIYNDMQPLLEYNHNHFFNDYQDFNNKQLETIKIF